MTAAKTKTPKTEAELKQLARLRELAEKDLKLCVEALRFGIEGVYSLGVAERRFWVKKLVNAQELLERVGK